VAVGVREFVEAAVVLERDGLPPVAGGSGDQGAWFMDALNLWHRERGLIEKKKRQAEEG